MRFRTSPVKTERRLSISRVVARVFLADHTLDVDSQVADLATQSTTRNSKKLGRLVLIPCGMFKDARNHPALHLQERVFVEALRTLRHPTIDER